MSTQEWGLVASAVGAGLAFDAWWALLLAGLVLVVLPEVVAARRRGDGVVTRR